MYVRKEKNLEASSLPLITIFIFESSFSPLSSFLDLPSFISTVERILRPLSPDGMILSRLEMFFHSGVHFIPCPLFLSRKFAFLFDWPLTDERAGGREGNGD